MIFGDEASKKSIFDLAGAMSGHSGRYICISFVE